MELVNYRGKKVHVYRHLDDEMLHCLDGKQRVLSVRVRTTFSRPVSAGRTCSSFELSGIC